VFVVLAFVSVQTASAAEARPWPAKPVTIIVPLAAGSGPDVVARMFAEKLSQRLGQPFVVENRPGNAQVVATVAVQKAAADGYTLGASTSAPFVIRPGFFKKPPYDPVKDFTPIAQYLKSPFVLVVNPKLPVKTVPELIAYIRANPGKITFASSAIGGPPHLAGEYMKRLFNLDMQNVPYTNSPQAFLDVAAGHIPMAFADLGTALPLVQEGRVRALAVTSLTPLASVPNLPTFAQAAGVADFEVVSWHMLYARAEVPKAIIDKLHSEMQVIMEDPAMMKRVAALGLMPQKIPPIAETRAYIDAEIRKWGELVSELGLARTL
jgi:tripartite-type tricarboxylate transporter receptor subunit TctC